MAYLNREMVARVCDLPSELNITSTEFAFLVVVARHVRKGGDSSWPGVKKVCQTARISEKTYQRTLKNLQAKGLIVLETLGRKRHFVLTLPHQDVPPYNRQNDYCSQDKMSGLALDNLTSQKLGLKGLKKKETEEGFQPQPEVMTLQQRLDSFDPEAYVLKCKAEEEERKRKAKIAYEEKKRQDRAWAEAYVAEHYPDEVEEPEEEIQADCPKEI